MDRARVKRLSDISVFRRDPMSPFLTLSDLRGRETARLHRAKLHHTPVCERASATGVEWCRSSGRWERASSANCRRSAPDNERLVLGVSSTSACGQGRTVADGLLISFNRAVNAASTQTTATQPPESAALAQAPHRSLDAHLRCRLLVDVYRFILVTSLAVT